MKEYKNVEKMVAILKNSDPYEKVNLIHFFYNKENRRYLPEQLMDLICDLNQDHCRVDRYLDENYWPEAHRWFKIFAYPSEHVRRLSEELELHYMSELRPVRYD